MSNDKGSSPSQLVYTCSNKSISNTTITSPDGRTSYIIETPVKWFKAKPTTLYIVNRDKEGESTAPQEVATINWKCFKPDLVTFAGQEPIRVKEVFPRRWYTCLWPGRTTSDPASGRRWRGEWCPELVDREGKVLAAYQKKWFKREAATFKVAPSEATNMNEIILGVIVMRKDAIRRSHARGGAGGAAGGS